MILNYCSGNIVMNRDGTMLKKVADFCYSKFRISPLSDFLSSLFQNKPPIENHEFTVENKPPIECARAPPRDEVVKR